MTIQSFGDGPGARLGSCEHVATPVGVPCTICAEPIQVHSSGVILAGVDADGFPGPVHTECASFRAVMGPNAIPQPPDGVR